jgi:hypothetical protein
MKRILPFFCLCLLLISILISGCKKNTAQTQDDIPQQYKDYGIFQVGSYWIFKNEITREIDSSYVLYPPNYGCENFFGVQGGPIWEYCFIDYGGNLILQASMTPYEYDITFPSKIMDDFYCPCLMSTSSEHHIVDDDKHYLFKNLVYFDSLEINNKMFYQVINSQWKWIHGASDTLTASYFIAKSIGFIKLKLGNNTSDTTWSLLRYHVIQ